MSSLFSSESASPVKRPSRLLIWLIPFFIILILAGLFFATGWKKLLPALEVDIARARMGEAAVVTKKGETLFQAAGWIEAAPYPIRVTALISGIVKKVHAIDGQKINKGDLLVEIIDDDLKLELANAEAELAELQLDKKKNELEVKTQRAKLIELDSLKDSAKAIAATFKHKAKVFRESQDALPEFEKDQADLEYLEKVKAVEEYDSRKIVILSQIELLKNGVALAESRINTQKVKIDKIKLDLSRTMIKSPVEGIIEHLHAREGRKQMLGSDNELSTTVARIFNPKEIQVRVDVPLSDVGKLKVGQQTKIHIEFLKESLAGHVTSIFGHADYQKNTLEVKVKIPGGHLDLRPDMLAQVEFVSDAPPVTDTQEKVSGIFVKKEALVEGTKLWVLSSDSKAILKTVEVGKAEKEGWIEIRSGINPGEKTIINAPDKLEHGAFVKAGKIYD